MLWTQYILAVSACILTISSASADSVPITRQDGLIWANVDCGTAHLHFVVDTGAASSCINLSTARRLHIPLGAPIGVAGVGGSTTGYECTGFRANAGTMALPPDVVALDLSGPARACHQPIDGLIGADFFRGKVLRIDYAHGLLTRADEPSTGAPLRIEDGVICVQVAVNGAAPRWTRLDTGCTEALCWCEGADCRRNPARKSIALAELTGTGIPEPVAIGGTPIGDLPVKLQDRAIFPNEAGLLGNAALCHYTVTIDGIGNRLLLAAAP